MSKVTDYYNLPIGSVVKELDRECKEGEPVIFLGKLLYTVKNTYTIISLCTQGKYFIQDANGNTKEVTADALMSGNYEVEPFRTKEEIGKKKWESMYNQTY